MGKRVETQDLPLLERLQRQLGCMYLSDLRTQDLKALQDEIRQISPGEYSLREWADAARYLTWHKEAFTDSGQAREFILQCRKRDF